MELPKTVKMSAANAAKACELQKWINALPWWFDAGDKIGPTVMEELESLLPPGIGDVLSDVDWYFDGYKTMPMFEGDKIQVIVKSNVDDSEHLIDVEIEG